MKLRPIVHILRAGLIGLAVAATACTTGLPGPAGPAAAIADGRERLLTGEPFQHRAFVAGMADPATDDRAVRRLHVYLTGDGSPWVRGVVPAADPTPRNPVAQRLMALDPNPRLLLGRPCYHGLAATPGCGPALWTSARYSEPVVASMAAALRGFIAAQAIDEVVLIGYSGGGVLAWLLAERVLEVRLLVTIAANLDTDAWTAHHRYLPLTGSLNPARHAPLPGAIAQLHLVGARDRNVPPDLIAGLVAGLPRAPAVAGADRQPVVVRVLPVDHACCWERHWPVVLDEIERLGRVAGPAQSQR